MNQVSFSSYYYLYALLFTISLGLFLWRFDQKPEQVWYQGRALAESVKTSSWRFCMRSQPFDDPSDASAISEFQNHLKSILSANQFAGTRLPPDFATDNQVTQTMRDLRQRDLEERKKIYDSERIQNQRHWYASKGRANRRAVKYWVIFCAAIYIFAIISSLIRATHPEYTWLPTEVFIAIASSIVGWIQLKKFNELAGSYVLTAHEIGIIHGKLYSISTEVGFADFVYEAEQAFSREHTQWVARVN